MCPVAMLVFLRDALILRGAMEPGIHIRDYKISKVAYARQVFDDNMTRHDIDLGRPMDEDILKNRLDNCPANRV